MKKDESYFEHENRFYLDAPPKRLGKCLAHFEIYKKIINLPGDVVEFGVFKGASLARLLTFRSLLESEDSREIIGFDAFGKFPKRGDESDLKFIKRFEDSAGDGTSRLELENAFHAKGFRNFTLIEGDILKSLPEFLEARPHSRFSFIHLDTDIYEPAVAILRHCYNRLVRGGVLVMDDYPTVLGETRAVDEYFEGHDVRIEKLSISHIPSFIVKS